MKKRMTVKIGTGRTASAMKRFLTMVTAFSVAAAVLIISPVQRVYASLSSQTSVVSVKADTLWGRTGAGEQFSKYGICVKNSSYRCYDSQRAEDGSLWYKVKDEKGSFFWIDSRYAENYTAPGGIIYSSDSYFSRQVVPKKDLVLYNEARPDSGTAAEVGTDCSLCVISDGVGSDNRSWFKVVCGNMTGWVSREDVNIYNSCDPIPERVFSSEHKPVIYLSPSNQVGNLFAAGETNEHIQCQAIAAELKKTLESRYDCTVYIANQMLAISASGRPSEAASLGADIYLAIHTNASGAGVSYGPQAYYYPGSEQSRILSENLVDSMKAVSPYYSTVTNVINGMNYLSGYGYGEVRSPGALGMISVLFEAEYHDHADSANWIIANTNDIASAIADGLNNTFSFPESGPLTDTVTTATDTQADAQTQSAETTVSASDQTSYSETTAAAASSTTSTAASLLETMPDSDKIEERTSSLTTYATTAATSSEVVFTTTSTAPTTTVTTASSAETSFSAVPAQTLTGTELSNLNVERFFEVLAPICREDMAESGILASVTLAQAALESSYGKSELSVNANNIFGMKQNLSGNRWNSIWNGQLYQKLTLEESNGVAYETMEQFRAYESINDGVRDHSRYLLGAPLGGGPRYYGISGERDHRKAAHIIASGGYATDSNYENKLISIIERYDLTKYDYIDGNIPTTAAATSATFTTTAAKQDIPIQSLQFASAPETMLIGETTVITLTTAPSYANENVSWSSSNTAIARVDASGKVTAVGTGTVRIAVRSSACSAYCDITVKPNVRPEMLGAGICITEPYGIRFATRIEKDTSWETLDVVSMGTLIIPKKVLNNAELILDTENVLNVVSTKKYSETDSDFVFTGKLSGISRTSFDTVIAARGYVIYRNADGSESALYSDVYESSFRGAAKDSLAIYEKLPPNTPDKEETIQKLEALIES